MRIIVIIISLIVLQSCDNKSLEKVNLKEFFARPEDYSNPKVLVHNVKTNEGSSLIYHLIEKVSDNRLKISEFNASFNLTTILIDSFSNKGVFLESMTIVENDSLHTEVNLNNGLIFPFESPSIEIAVESSFRIPTEKNIEVTDLSKWQLLELIDDEIIIAKGSHKKIISDDQNYSDTINLDIEIWYKKGLGIIKNKSCSGTYCEEINYQRTITLDEFNNLMKINHS